MEALYTATVKTMRIIHGCPQKLLGTNIIYSIGLWVFPHQFYKARASPGLQKAKGGVKREAKSIERENGR